MTRPPSNERADVVAHSLKGRRTYASTRWPFDEARLSELVGRSYDRSYYPEGTTRQWAAILAGPPRTERLKGLTVPTLVLHGSADTLIRPQAGRHTAECIPGAEYHEIEGWGHDMPLPAIPEISALILDFVNRVETSSSPAAAKMARSTA
jgi:pimeloyl-ACP methyl ester carboxylesterase